MFLKISMLAFMTMFLFETAQAIEVDFSRRTRQPASDPTVSTVVPDAKVRDVKSIDPKSTDARMGEFVSHASHERDWGNVDRQEVVIMNTDHGFVPSNVRFRKNMHYLIHVVNVNKQNKNVSFMLDAFNQHHSTFYGDTKTFKLDPEKEGVFEFQCPETNSSGKMVVYGPSSPPVGKDRSTASQGD